ncbi:MAG: acyl carrier protein [Pseudomonadota bacterium]
MEASTYHYLCQILIAEFDIDAEAMRPDAQLGDELGLDSIDAVDLLVHLRETTGHEIARERFKAVRTLQDIVNIIDSENIPLEQALST